MHAVDDLNLSVPVGQVVGLLGPNGAGKTTTIKMMCGLVTPTSGRVHLHGYDVARERPMAVRQGGAVLEGAATSTGRSPRGRTCSTSDASRGCLAS